MDRKVGDLIFFDFHGSFQIDRIKELVEIDGETLINPSYWDNIVLTEKDLLDDNDIRVKEYTEEVNRLFNKYLDNKGE